ncbi:aldehyde dehydrogenase [Gordonia otitidis]|uniref:Aldehyde dehydrogenase n=1 Tax=Gordonia otitidis (strain DSM 44809 / CCUG 52243 / JCM 12355 / NBRC 100426 / IFM 10032) TaxID=1108044 RepID=H5TFT5_GORO1|nr:aldehyde dehydrogenase [Gordonia otitidis]GAB32343.1 putative aldehyde dehydrogenase [Gordonia otitidis NBRC 100426]
MSTATTQNTLPTGDKPLDSLFIGGEWVVPQGTGQITVISPNTGDPIGAVPDGTAGDIDAAVRAARAAFDDPRIWSGLPAAQRAAHLRRFADEIDARKDDFATLVSAQNGMPIGVAAQLEAVYPATLLRYYADLVEAQGPDVRDGMFGGKVDVRREPIGVVGAIVPWNFPQTLAAFKFAPALAAGCTLVIKPSPETVLDSHLLAEAAEAAGLPAGVINIVPGGREVGAYLVSHPDIDKVAFTGSTAAGTSIAETCGRLLRPVTLELGGKSATIVLDDAELDLATIGNELFVATLANNGQTCFLGTRVLAPRSRYDEVVDVLTAFASSMQIGDSLDATTQIGPMASERHRERVEGYISKGRAEGGRITTGGGRPSGVDAGWFVQPTVFAGLDNSATIAREEIFGPVLTVIGYEDDADAVAIANDSEFGLGGTVWSSNEDRARAVAAAVRTGTIGINRYIPDPVAPFGGVKHSGMGRELGPEGLAAYQNLKSVYC